ncbi:MAG: tetratricopeptide repeat protein, partial [Nostoc sp.]|uniref:tetratricopeptide repeat protein n=1 Tax=Nostoc sp. TaxID=1180 RepID=UPI002FF88AD0
EIRPCIFWFLLPPYKKYFPLFPTPFCGDVYLEEAIANLDKALAIKPDLYEAWFNQGIILGCLEQPEEALASYDKALEIRPNKYQA